MPPVSAVPTPSPSEVSLESSVDFSALMAPGYVQPPDEPRMSWAHIAEVLSTGSLGDLDRAISCQKEYDNWAHWVRSRGVSLEQLLRYRLGWPEDAPFHAHAKTETGAQLAAPPPDAPNVMPGTPPEFPPASALVADKFLVGLATPPNKPPFLVHTSPGIKTKIIPNDWPYSVPEGGSHWVAWADVPIVHPALFAEYPPDPEREVSYSPPPAVTAVLSRDRKNAYAAVSHDGVRGLTGWEMADPELGMPEGKRHIVGMSTLDYTQKVVAASPEHQNSSQSESDQAARELAGQLQAWAARHVEAMVRDNFPPDKYQSAWFCNPPHLRTVPGLSHFQYV